MAIEIEDEGSSAGIVESDISFGADLSTVSGELIVNCYNEVETYCCIIFTQNLHDFNVNLYRLLLTRW